VAPVVATNWHPFLLPTKPGIVCPGALLGYRHLRHGASLLL